MSPKAPDLEGDDDDPVLSPAEQDRLLDEALEETFPASDAIAPMRSPQASGTRPTVRVKRVYEPAAPEDGARVLVDRLWPRGLSKGAAGLAAWIKDIAPSEGLRKWFGHDPARWPEFHRRYTAELRGHADQLDRLRTLARTGPITLVYAAHDELHNDAVVLREFLLKPGKIRTSLTPDR